MHKIVLTRTPTKTYLAQSINSAEVEKPQGPSPHPVCQQIKKLGLWKLKSSRIICQDIHLGGNQEEHAVEEAGMVPRPLPPVCHW